MQRARQLQAAGRIDEAIAVYRGLLLQQPANADAHFLLGVTLARKGEWRGAEDHMARAVTLRPEWPSFIKALACTTCTRRICRRRIDCLRKAVAARPDFAVAHNNLGTALRRSGDLAGALASGGSPPAEARPAAPPSDSESFTVVSRTKLRHDIEQLGHLRARNILPQSYDGTIDAYEKVLASLPEGPDAPAFFRLGREHRQMIGSTYNRLVNWLPMPAHEIERREVLICLRGSLRQPTRPPVPESSMSTIC